MLVDERLVARMREYLYIVALQSLYDALCVLKSQFLPEFLWPRRAEGHKIVDHVALWYIVVARVHEIEQRKVLR